MSVLGWAGALWLVVAAVAIANGWRVRNGRAGSERYDKEYAVSPTTVNRPSLWVAGLVLRPATRHPHRGLLDGAIFLPPPRIADRRATQAGERLPYYLRQDGQRSGRIVTNNTSSRAPINSP